MDLFPYLQQLFVDPRFDANLIAGAGVVALALVGFFGARRLLLRGRRGLQRGPGHPWLDTISEEATQRLRRLLFWTTALTVGGAIVGGLAYHGAGRDIRHDSVTLVEQWTTQDTVAIVLRLGSLVLLAGLVRFAVWLINRALPFLEVQLLATVTPFDCEAVARRGLQLFRTYALVAVRLAALWLATVLVGLERYAGPVVGFALSLLTILVAARLLTLSWRVGTRVLGAVGDRHLGRGPFHRYWERITRMFPFAERCFEAAVYVSAASLCVRELQFIHAVADFGPRIVKCIGIVFGTRVVIELLQVLLNEAFGMYDEQPVLDQKGRTLVPLLHSVCQYTLYLGSIIVMLGVLGIDTTPILAGAGIVGLAVGLGAQNLVTDVVSGFFILFENQYLVGDFVQIGGADGTVEAVSIRLTQLRDDQGKLHIIPNGQIKSVVNYSKGYINAIVDVKMPTGSDVEAMFRAMADAGRRLAQTREEVLAETEIQGIIEWDSSELTVRAVTRVQPGSHLAMQNEYRRLLRQTLEQEPMSRRSALASA